MRTDLALAALASAAVPGMKPVAVAGIAPSDDDRASELQSALVEDATGRRWLVRAPLTPVAGARLQRNDELVRQLSRHVPFKVPAAAGYAPVGKDGSAAVYPHIEGSPLDLRRLPAGPGLASAVGRALAAVHNIPRAVFEEQDVPVFDASGARQRAIAEVDRAAETGRVPTGLLARWEEAFEAAPMWQFATTPVHGSFTGASMVVAFTDEDDAASGRVVAITDWDEAMVGDPAVDLAELWARTSRQAWDAVLDSYALARAQRPDPYLHARARLVAELRALRGLARSVADGDEETARRCVEALRRMDRLTEADDSLVPVTARPSGARPSAAGAVEPAGHEGLGPVATPTAQTLPDDVGVDEPTSAETSPTEEAVVPGPADPTTEVPAPADPAADDSSTSTSSSELEQTGEGTESRDDAQNDADATVQIPTVTHEGLTADEMTDDDVRPVERPDPGVDEAGPQDDDTGAAGDETGAEDDRSGSQEPGSDRSAPAAGADASVEPEYSAEADDVSVESEAGDAAAPSPAAGPVEEAASADVEDLRDEERLQELYGMPSPERDTEER